MSSLEDMSAAVIIPTYNERENIARLTDRLLRLGIRLDIIFVDDNSPDGTGMLSDELAKSFREVSVIHRPNKLGYGSAVIPVVRCDYLI